MIDRATAWFSSKRWTPFDFQLDCWRAYLDGKSGLLHAPTGAGKTLAVWLAPLLEHATSTTTEPLRILWITPLRALSNDTAQALLAPVRDLNLPFTVQTRTGDTSSHLRAKQRKAPPSALITTPESLSILLSYPEAAAYFSTLRAVIVDEWHELLSSKRGVLTELALARLRTLAPSLRTWGLSATLANLDEAARALVGHDAPAPALVHAPARRDYRIETILPPTLDRFPWAGHIGIRLLDQVIDAILSSGTTLLFTNTRSQSEIWFREILRRRPDLLGRIAIHHGSLDRDIRQEVEAMLRADGQPSSQLRCVVCTSSLDLGVDFTPVDQVIQIGSPRGVARLLQRAGRSGHRPGAVSRILCVPTNALDLLDFAAARDAANAGLVEPRAPLHKPLDVLAQHLVTVGCGGGFDEPALLNEVRSTAAYHDLSDDEWKWAMEFSHQGGPSLHAYPRFARITHTDARWRVASPIIARNHRMDIGVIVADAAVSVQYRSGRVLGSIEESFISRLTPGDRFVFAGRTLELIRLREMTAHVRPARKATRAVPRWQGSKMPLSSHLASAVRKRLADASRGVFEGPELTLLRPLLELQASISRIPAPDELLIETLSTRDGHHAFLFPFAGRLAHEALAPLLAWRISQRDQRTIQTVVNDFGIELLSNLPLTLCEADWRAALSPDNLVDDLLRAINAGELARRQFREIARIAGLTPQGYPGRPSPARRLQASSDMFFDVFTDFDPGNLLLSQARREVLEGQFEITRVRDSLDWMSRAPLLLISPPDLTPLSFPLWAESLRATTVSTQRWEDRVRDMVVRLERANTPAARQAKPDRAPRKRKPSNAPRH